jgi:hypothetical protein
MMMYDEADNLTVDIDRFRYSGSHCCVCVLLRFSSV